MLMVVVGGWWWLIWLFGRLFIFPCALGRRIPADQYFSEGLKPPTSICFDPAKMSKHGASRMSKYFGVEMVV